MRSDNLDLIVQQNYQTFTTSFYLRSNYDGRVEIIGQKDGRLQSTIINPLQARTEIPPLIEMPDYMAEDFIKKIVDYANTKGVSSENENLLKGKLAATEKHLEDMRLAFQKLIESK